jgi:hypothetical protein
MRAEPKAVLEAFFEDHAKSGLQLNKSVRPLFDDLVDLSQEDIDAFCAPAARFKRPLQGPHSPCRPARSRTRRPAQFQFNFQFSLVL